MCYFSFGYDDADDARGHHTCRGVFAAYEEARGALLDAKGCVRHDHADVCVVHAGALTAIDSWHRSIAVIDGSTPLASGPARYALLQWRAVMTSTSLHGDVCALDHSFCSHCVPSLRNAFQATKHAVDSENREDCSLALNAWQQLVATPCARSACGRYYIPDLAPYACRDCAIAIDDAVAATCAALDYVAVVARS